MKRFADMPLEYLQSARSEKNENKCFPTETPNHYMVLTFSKACGRWGHVFATSACEASLEQGGTDTASNIPTKLRIFASYLPIKFLSILKRHLTTDVQHSTHSATNTQRSTLAAVTTDLPPPVYCCGRVLDAWEDVTARGACQRP